LKIVLKVVLIDIEKFGRQIASNASVGTDHGDAAPLFLFGSCLSQPIYGSNPIISDQVKNQAGVPKAIWQSLEGGFLCDSMENAQ
jgi:uncharacterized protein (DUF1501 family)